MDAAKIVAFPEVESETFPPAEIPHFIGATDTPGPEILDAATTEAIAAAAAAGASATSTLPPVEQAFNAIMVIFGVLWGIYGRYFCRILSRRQQQQM